MKKIILLAAVIMSGCSSPPEPPQVDWGNKPESMNSQLPSWQPTNRVIKSEKVTSTWMKVVRNFLPENRLYDDSVFYAVAHSPEIIVEASNGSDFFTAKKWLRNNGAYGVIQYRYKSNGFGVRSTNIYFERG
ncbi:TPA: conjugal transfer protein [Escherichia coli]|jgi:PBP1b-binding outer membrane lipoprotein LpoB|uniref:cag pathogenicity island Cag12 family protein n=1 Tax=Pantoea sp. CCBC3-3-1 TaxID=2490851 RepID=UPI0011BDF10F|nr:cag pathogenicity island Cag12 family protein [Pantoea sp. CCBC3-3-1]HDT5032197.1 conjugal transfer protein [Escherichia coli]